MKPGHKRGSPICKGTPDDESGEESDRNNSGDESIESENQDENADDHMVTVEEHSSEIEEHRELGEKSGEPAISDAKEGSMDDKGIKLKIMDQWIAVANSSPASGHERTVSSPGKIRKAGEKTPDEKAKQDAKKKKSGRKKHN